MAVDVGAVGAGILVGVVEGASLADIDVVQIDCNGQLKVITASCFATSHIMDTTRHMEGTS